VADLDRFAVVIKSYDKNEDISIVVGDKKDEYTTHTDSLLSIPSHVVRLFLPWIAEQKQALLDEMAALMVEYGIVED
jgi:hypothetical protein